eukprot:g39514.t1
MNRLPHLPQLPHLRHLSCGLVGELVWPLPTVKMVSIEGTDLEATFQRYMALPVKGKVLAEYVWIGNLNAQNGVDLRCKTRTLNLEKVTSLDELPAWNYDGSSTGQAPGHDSEVYLMPVQWYPDPFRLGNNIIVLCEACLPDGKMTPIPTNKRRQAAEWLSQKSETEPWFGIEQEYTMFAADGITPLGWPKGGYPKPQGPFYCSAGTGNSFGRRVVEAHYRACLYMGINISGINGEVLPGQWEYQIGPCVGIESGDQMTISRYILLRVAEDFGVVISFDPKPVPGDWNGSGCHTNFSTKAMREEGGFDVIVEAVEKLGKQHAKFIAAYGEGNERRLTGRHETASINKFSWGVADRGASVRVGRQAKLENKGYFEDRRPASNMDPYVVTGMIYNCTVLDHAKKNLVMIERKSHSCRAGPVCHVATIQSQLVLLKRRLPFKFHVYRRKASISRALKAQVLSKNWFQTTQHPRGHVLYNISHDPDLAGYDVDPIGYIGPLAICIDSI